jgi:hypothetical protein
LSVKGQKNPQICLGDPNTTAEVVRNQVAGRDSASDRAGTNAKHFRYLGDGEKLDSVAPIIPTLVFQTTRFCAAATRAPSPVRHYSRSSDWAAASCRATYALMLATVIFRERPSL